MRNLCLVLNRSVRDDACLGLHSRLIVTMMSFGEIRVMNIIGKLKSFISGVKVEPVEQVATHAVPQPKQMIMQRDSNPQGIESEPRSLTMGKLQNVPSSIEKTLGELQSEPLSAWGNNDIIMGLEFCATMQLRTPLRVLLRHGELHTDRDTKPQEIACERWEGVWLPKIVHSHYYPSGTHASEIGQIIVGDYLPFLISIREIVEIDDSIENRIGNLREMFLECDRQEFLSRHGGSEKIVHYFFPRHITPMPKLSASVVSKLSRLGLDTPSRIAAAPDETLLGVKGIGPAKLNAMRGHCADMAKHRDADRVENVTR